LRGWFVKFQGQVREVEGKRMERARRVEGEGGDFKIEARTR
jgi:hypothetical protein